MFVCFSLCGQPRAHLEEVAFHLLNHLHLETGLTDLGRAGGVAYNSVMNGKILEQIPFRRVFVQPAAGDSGTAIGLCYQVAQVVNLRKPTGVAVNRARQTDSSRYAFSPFTGREFSDEEIENELQISDLKFQKYSEHELIEQGARAAYKR